MFNWFKRKQAVLLSREELTKIIFRQCDAKVHSPLDKVYKLVPDHRWLLNRTPVFAHYQKDYNDCNHLACLMMAKTQSHCVGMVVVGTDNPNITHCVNLVCMEDMSLQLYDPVARTLKPAKMFNIKRIWL